MQLCSDTFIVNYFQEMWKELGAGPEDLEGMSRAVTQRNGVGVSFLQSARRGPGVYWMVMRRR
jgi:hypothetical protein